jgi:hypothetical protein
MQISRTFSCYFQGLFPLRQHVGAYTSVQGLFVVDQSISAYGYSFVRYK